MDDTNQTKLVVLRGPSGSGKSSVARAVRASLKIPIAIVEQDYLRRIVLKEKDVPGGKNVDLIRTVVEFALAEKFHVILEGILDQGRYGAMFEELLRIHPKNNYFYYFNVTFEETLKRHQLKPNREEFGENEMRAWYKELDLLGLKNEEIISEQSTFEETVRQLSKIFI